MGRLRLTLLVLVAAIFPLLWVASHIWYLGYFGESGAGSFEAVIGNGNIYVSKENLKQSAPGFYFGRVGREWFRYDNWDFAGFNRKPYPDQPGIHYSFIRVPLWFLSCVGFGFSWWVWRRVRRRRATGFPVSAAPVK